MAKKEPEELVAVMYARYPGENQREESIEGQLRENYAFSKKNGVKVISATEHISEGSEGILLDHIECS